MKSIVVCFFVFLHSGIESSVIPPPWADERINPCAKYSWQYLFWQADGQCYPIFRQGPCSPTQELVFDAADKSVKCQCPSDQVEWQDGRCYEPFMQGPCPKNTFLHPGKEIQQRPQRLEPNRRVLLQMQVNKFHYTHCCLTRNIGEIAFSQLCRLKWSNCFSSQQCRLTDIELYLVIRNRNI